MFLAKAFREYDKIYWTRTKICSLGQGSRSASIYALDFRQLGCDFTWDGEALTSQFH